MKPSSASHEVSIKDLNIRKPYFNHIARGAKTVEVRVAYPKMKRIQPGQRIRFISGDSQCLTVVRRVATYDSFEEMLQAENPAFIAPDISSVDELLQVIRGIYPPEKEALGVLAIHIQLEQPPNG